MSDKFAILPFKTARIKDKFLLTTILGDWIILKKEDFRKVHSYSVKVDSPLFKRLKAKGILSEGKNINRCLDTYQKLNQHLSSGVSLHIAVLTESCNFSCKYCQTKEDKSSCMDIKVAGKILDFLIKSKSKSKTLEFQGGEPLLCWDALKWLVKNARKVCQDLQQSIRLSLVSNLSLLDEEKLGFLLSHNMGICTSLDGPRYVHDQQRIYADGRPTYSDTVKKIKMVNREYKKRGLKKRVDLLPTITRYSLGYAKEIVDEYVKWKVKCIPIRFVNPLKKASRGWGRLGYSPEEFNQFWKESMDYIIELNKRGVFIYERMAQVLLTKILKKTDPFYVDLSSPCGGGRNVLTYMPNGDVYTCDEARMIKSDLFKLGNLLKDSYEQVMKSPNLVGVCQSSFLELWDYASPYTLWSGTCPVMNFFGQNNPVVKISQTPYYKIYNFQLNYLLDKINSSKNTLTIFNKWYNLDRGGCDEKK